MKLYRVCLKVRPSKDHPRFFAHSPTFIPCFFIFCALEGQLFGNCYRPFSCIVRVFAINPYIQKSELHFIRLAGGDKLPEFQLAEKRAKTIGVAVLLHELALGCNDQDLVAADPP